MRPVLAILTTVLILGGLQGYFLLRDRFGPTAPVAIEHPAPGVYSLEITLTFDAGPDPFALAASDQTCLEVLFRGQTLLRRVERVSAGEKVVITPIEDIVAGKNEFVFKASPADSRPEMAYAARVRLLRDDAPIAEQSLWSESGGIVEGKLLVVVEDSKPVHDEHPGAKP
jgi:antitoxin (DNA-binding transcriptional repressor) of toxin-antitoxin stability system